MREVNDDFEDDQEHREFFEGVFVESSGLEELPEVLDFDCPICGFEWRQTYIPEVTDV